MTVIGEKDSGVRAIARARPELARMNRFARSFEVLSRRANLWVLLLSMACGGLMAIARGADHNWDLLNYHLYNPFAYLQGRYSSDIGPAQVQSYYNPVVDIPFYLMIRLINTWPRLIAFVLGALHGLNFFMLFRIVKLLVRDDEPGQEALFRVAAIAIGVTGAGVLGLLGTTTNDLIGTIFVLAALLACLGADAGDAGSARAKFLLGGLSLGVAIGLKLTMAIFVPGFAFLVLYRVVATRGYCEATLFATASLAGLVLVAGHQMWALWQLFGNPIFPMFNDYFHSPFYEPANFRDTRFLPSSTAVALIYPFLWAVRRSTAVCEIPFRDIRLALAEIVIIAASVAAAVRFWRDRGHTTPSPERRLALLIAFLAISYCFWIGYFAIYRYALVLEMLSGPVIVLATMRLVPRGRLQIAAVVALTVAALATTRNIDMGHGRFEARYIDVEVPRLEAGGQLLIIGDFPVGYVVPFLDPSVRVLSIENNYLHLDQHNRLVARLRQAVEEPVFPRYVLISPATAADKIQATLNALGLSLRGDGCQAVRSNIQNTPLQICPVLRRA